MSTWVRDSSGNLVNLDRYNQVVLERADNPKYCAVYVNSPDELIKLIVGEYEDCKRYYDALLEYLGFNIWVKDSFMPGKKGKI